jgi:hypothetical protein
MERLASVHYSIEAPSQTLPKMACVFSLLTRCRSRRASGSPIRGGGSKAEPWGLRSDKVGSFAQLIGNFRWPSASPSRLDYGDRRIERHYNAQRITLTFNDVLREQAPTHGDSDSAFWFR